MAHCSGEGFSIFGDSISTLGGWCPDGWRLFYEGEVEIEGIKQPEDTWWGKVIDHFGGHLVRNASFSGSVVEGYGFPAGNSRERAAELVGSDGEQPDVVLVYIGINDYGWGCGLNQIVGRTLSASAAPEDFDEPPVTKWTAGAPELERFRVAYAEMLANIKEVAPCADVWCLTLAPGFVKGVPAGAKAFPWRIRGVELDAYNDAIRGEAQAAGAQVADVRAFGVSYESCENVHPTAAGMNQLAAMVISQMEGEPADAGALPELAGLPASERGCDKPNCIGCEFIKITESGWDIYCGKWGSLPQV